MKDDTKPTPEFVEREAEIIAECVEWVRELCALDAPGDRWNPGRIAREIGAGGNYKWAVYKMRDGNIVQAPSVVVYERLKKLHALRIQEGERESEDA